jgi:hypothetical protein
LLANFFPNNQSNKSITTNTKLKQNLNDTTIHKLLYYIQNPDKINDIHLDQILNIFSKAHYLHMSSLMENLINRLINLKIYNTYFD